MLNIQIHSIKELYSISSDADLSGCAAILATSGEIRPEKLLGVGRLLVLEFDDCLGGGAGAFNGELAGRIRDFTEGLPRETDTLFCCCDCGESRSAAIAAALMRRFGQNELSVWRDPKYHPNGLVYGVLCEVLGVPARDEELAEKINLSEKAFNNAISRH